MFSFGGEEEEEPCELVRACNALHCPLCDSVFSSNEDDQRAPLILMCGHSICRSCLAEGLTDLWNADPDEEQQYDDGDSTKRPPGTCPECGESFSPTDQQATLPFFNAALAHTVLQLQSLAKGMTFSPGASVSAAAPEPAAETSKEKETADVAVQTDEALEEEYSRARWPPAESTPVKETPAENSVDTVSAAGSADDEKAAAKEPAPVRKPKVASTNPFECDSPRDPNAPLPPAVAKAADGPSQKRFSYYPVILDKVGLHEGLSVFISRHVIPPILPGVTSLRVHVSKDAPRVQKVVKAAEEAMIPVFVPFLSFTLMACINGKEVYCEDRTRTDQYVTCAWELHSGRDAANETIDDPLIWKQNQLRICDPDERPRPGLWLPASTLNSDTVPKAMPKMPALRTEAVASPFAQELDKRTRSEYESQLQSCPNALTVRVIKPVLFYAPFWVASVKLPEFCSVVVNALNGNVAGSATPIFDIVRDAKNEHKSSIAPAPAASSETQSQE